MDSFDFCVAWNWPDDADFVSLIRDFCKQESLSLLEVTPGNLCKIMQSLVNKQLGFQVFFDRASDTGTSFHPVLQWAKNNASYHINPQELSLRSQDKSIMHPALISAGLYTPHTIVLPSHSSQPVLEESDLSCLGRTFTIKPAHGGGGDGVVNEATTWKQVLDARLEYPEDKYLLQAQVVPKAFGLRRAWFRVIYCAGRIYPSWWDTPDCVYSPVSYEEERLYSLSSLRTVTASLARLCGLELFSTEIALTEGGLFVVVDYVNDQIDMRLQSRARDGVPDSIVEDVARRIVGLAKAHCLRV